jgi:uncharacterized protein YcfL
MKKLIVTLVLSFIFLSGCDSFRFAPTEEQKQNAYLHSRTTAIAADAAKAENCSQKLQALTNLSEVQSRAFVAYTVDCSPKFGPVSVRV